MKRSNRSNWNRIEQTGPFRDALRLEGRANDKERTPQKDSHSKSPHNWMNGDVQAGIQVLLPQGEPESSLLDSNFSPRENLLHIALMVRVMEGIRRSGSTIRSSS